MKKTLILFIQLLVASCCFSQSIDTSALHILQKSYDRLAAMKTISYRMSVIDTNIRTNSFRVGWYTVRSTEKKDAYWYLKVDEKVAWLLRGDTLYRKQDPKIESVTFTTDWDRHEWGAMRIYSILGDKRPVVNNDLLSLKFKNDTSASDFYCIEEVFRPRSKIATPAEDEVSYETFYIHKKSLFAYRRVKYAKWFDNEGQKVIDIYDFTASLDTNPPAFNNAAFFVHPAVPEADHSESLKVGAPAPAFKAIDVRSGKPVSLKSLKGKVVVLDFWYLSCAPCKKLMPKLQQLHEKFAKQNVVIISVNIRDHTQREIMHFLKEKKITYSQYYQPEVFVDTDYKLRYFPTTFVIGKDGKIKLAEVGVAENSESTLELAIKKELKAKLI